MELLTHSNTYGACEEIQRSTITNSSPGLKVLSFMLQVIFQVNESLHLYNL